MKKIILIAALLGAMFSVTAYFICVAAPGIFFGDRIKGSGIIVTRTVEAPSFEKIEASRAVKVVVTDKATDRITIEADDNLADFVVVKTKGNTLVATLDKKVNSISNADITITVPASPHINALWASSAASIRTDAVLKADKFSLDASSASKIDATVEAASCSVSASSAAKIDAELTVTSCRVEASSASKITLKGSAEQCSIDLSSASKLSAGDLRTVDCKVDTSSAANARVHCTGELRASASSGSSIGYSGDCETIIDQSSGGRVHKN